MAWLDLSTGDFFTTVSTRNQIEGDLARCSPKELIIPKCYQSYPHDLRKNDIKFRKLKKIIENSKRGGYTLTYRESEDFDHLDGKKLINEMFKLSKPMSSDGREIFEDDHYGIPDKSMASLDCHDLSVVEFEAISAILNYVKHTQKGKFPLFRYPQSVAASHLMHIDANTRKSLELVEVKIAFIIPIFLKFHIVNQINEF